MDTKLSIPLSNTELSMWPGLLLGSPTWFESPWSQATNFFHWLNQVTSTRYLENINFISLFMKIDMREEMLFLSHQVSPSLRGWSINSLILLHSVLLSGKPGVEIPSAIFLQVAYNTTNDRKCDLLKHLSSRRIDLQLQAFTNGTQKKGGRNGWHCNTEQICI